VAADPGFSLLAHGCQVRRNVSLALSCLVFFVVAGQAAAYTPISDIARRTWDVGSVPICDMPRGIAGGRAAQMRGEVL
jgi:hypothetical protein